MSMARGRCELARARKPAVREAARQPVSRNVASLAPRAEPSRYPEGLARRAARPAPPPSLLFSNSPLTKQRDLFVLLPLRAC